MAATYLPRAETLGAVIRPHTRVERLVHERGIVKTVEATGHDGRRLRYRPRTVFLAAGATGSPTLLRRSGIHRRRAGRNMALHVNLRTIARFPRPVDSHNGTIFTAQVQEFSDLGILIMPSNQTAGTLGAALAGRDPRTVGTYLDEQAHLATYTTQVRLQGTAAITAVISGTPLLRHHMTSADHHALRLAFRRTAELLLTAGATELLPPTRTIGALRTWDDVEAYTARVRPADWELVSVHGMAGCRMARPERDGICDERGRPHGFTNLHVCDAGVLPGATGISPQGTIMTYAHEIVHRHLESA